MNDACQALGLHSPHAERCTTRLSARASHSLLTAFTVCLVSVHHCEILVLCRTAVHAKVVLHEPAVQHSEAFTCERAADFSHTVTPSHASLGSFTIDTTQCGPGVVTDGAVRYKSTRIFQPLAAGANRANEPGPLQHDVGVAQELTTLKARCVAVHG